MKNNEMANGDIIDDFEKIIDNYQDINKLQLKVFIKNIKKISIIKILFIILISIAIFILFKPTRTMLPKWAGFILFVFLSLLLAYFQLKNMAGYLIEIGFDCKNWYVAWSKLEYFRDKIFYNQMKDPDEMKNLKQLKQYVLWKIKEKKREWFVPKLFTLGIIGAIGYSFVNIYLNKLSAGNFNLFIIASIIFFVISFFVLIFEFNIRSVIRTFGKQNKYSELLSSIDVAIIRLGNEKKY